MIVDNELKYYYFEIRALRSLSPKSRAYRKTLKRLRESLSFAVTLDWINAREGEPCYAMQRENKRLSYLAAVSFLLCAATLILMVLFGGDTSVQAFTPAETKAFFCWLTPAVLFGAVGIFAGFRAQNQMNHYILDAVSRFSPDTEDISDEELRQIIQMMNDQEDGRIEEGAYAQLSCYACEHIFATSEYPDECPFCGRENTLVGAADEKTLTPELLRKTRRYWA